MAGWLGRKRGAVDGASFAAEVARLNAAKVAGESGRLRDLFDYLAARGPEAPSASQADIADAVFGQTATEGDDATVRVYVHRLRKRLEDFYDKDAGISPA
ncbi:MAG: helix-turn-helix domain-containing protein, partial [Croceibacterium sp.]